MIVGRRRWLVGLALVLALGSALGSALGGALVFSSMQRLSGLLGPRRAIAWRVELGLFLARARAKKTLLLAGDSRLDLPGSLSGDGWSEVNAAIGGTAVRQWQAWLVERPNARRYDAVVFWAGVNDFLHLGAAVDATADQLVAVTQRLRGYAQHVFVLEQIPVRVTPQEGDSRQLSARAVELNRALRERLAGAPNVTIVAAHDELRAADGLLERWCSDDGLHFNETGRAWLKRRIENSL